jgi:hypothetical protein
MWRGLVTAWFIYGCGHPSLDGYRPASLDRPLQSFYQEVNATVRGGWHMLVSIGDTRLARDIRETITNLRPRAQRAD